MERAGDLLKDIFKDSVYKKAGKFSSFFRKWQMLAGDELEKHTRVIDIKNHTIIVEADHPGWVQLLFMKKRKILFLIKKLYPELEIRRMRIVLAKNQDQFTKLKKTEKQPELPENNDNKEDDEFLNIKNKELKEILKRFYSSVQENQ